MQSVYRKPKTASLLLALLLMLPAGHSVAQRPGSQPLSDLRLVGQGTMRWYFWELYYARLYSADGRFWGLASLSLPAAQPIALAIVYNRDIKQRHLLQATTEEWNRLSVDWSAGWATQLEAIWPAVTQGDELIVRVNSLVVTPEPRCRGCSQFWFNGELVGEISDPAFGPAFLSIWLSPETREPALRKQLTGESRD